MGNKLRTILDGVTRFAETPVGVAVLIAAFLGGLASLNMVLNNRAIERPAYRSVSLATGLSGHIEYTRYTDGSQDVKEYPGLSHRFFDSELHQDLNGDGLVDRIRQNGAEWKFNRLSELLVREHDYQAHKERFDEADRQLQELMKKYPPKERDALELRDELLPPLPPLPWKVWKFF